MKIIGNILWLLCGGLLSALCWAVAGCLWCITIAGIPVGLQCFKFARLSLWPFGSEVHYGGGASSLLLNLLWLVITGLPIAISHALWGCVLCITIIGIPFGRQFFKLSRLALMPFGSEIL